MPNTYTWIIKNLSPDQRGHAQSIYLELQGTDGTNTVLSSSVSIFSGEDYKPIGQWVQADIEAWAITHQPNLKNSIDEQITALTARLTALEAK